MMRILAVSYVLPPSLYPQAIQIGRLLAHCPGEIVVVSGGSSAHAGLDRDFGLGKNLSVRLEVNFSPRLSGVMQVLARKFVPFYGRVPDEYRGWIPLAERVACAHLKESNFTPDVFVTFGEPMSDHLVGLRLKNQTGLPWVAHFSDPWAVNPFRRHEVLANFINSRLESKVIAAADRLIFTSDETLDLTMRNYPAPWRAKALVLPHSFDPALYPEPKKPTGPLTVRYLGNFYGHRTPAPLFVALDLMLEQNPGCLDNVRFELIGSMPKRMQRHRVLRSLPDGLVRLCNSVPYSESLALMSRSDLLLVIDGADDLSVFLPSKVIDYLGARVPVLGIVPLGASAKLLTRLGAPIADPRNPAKVMLALRRALNEVEGRRRAVDWQPWGDLEISRGYHVKNIATQFSQILEDTARQSGV